MSRRRLWTVPNVFLRADQDGAKKCCQMDWIGCAILQVAQDAIMAIQFFVFFLLFPHKVDNEKRCQMLESLFVVLFSSTP